MVFGAGISGIGAAKVLADNGNAVILYDAKQRPVDSAVIEKLRAAGGDIVFGTDAQTIIEQVDIIVLSPGVSVFLPILERAKALGKKIVSEVEIAYLLNKGSLIAITGTNGKTTTTTLVGEMLKQLPVKTAVGGNIGLALSEQAAELESANDVLIAEISSFQLEAVEQFHPHIGAILNITPDHLDRHKTFDGYVAAKAELFKNQTAEDYAILNADDTHIMSMVPNIHARICYFSTAHELPEGIFVAADGVITLKFQGREVRFCNVSAMKLFGRHNIENALVACACAYFAGVSPADIVAVLTAFQGVEHRIEYITAVREVKYYNDSKATNPESTVKALEAFTAPLILIAGGYDKLTDLTEMMQLVKTKTIHAVFLGNAKVRFAQEALNNGVSNLTVADSFEKALQIASKIAMPGQVVLLSPACSSYDMFDNYEQRGRYFKDLVHQLTK